MYRYIEDGPYYEIPSKITLSAEEATALYSKLTRLREESEHFGHRLRALVKEKTKLEEKHQNLKKVHAERIDELRERISDLKHLKADVESKILPLQQKIVEKNLEIVKMKSLVTAGEEKHKKVEKAYQTLMDKLMEENEKITQDLLQLFIDGGFIK